MKVSDVCRAGDGFVDVDISVSPRSNRPGPDGYDEWRRRMILRVSAPPLDGRANKEVCQYFSGLTGSKAEVTVGQTSRQKTVRMTGDPKRIMSSLEAVDGRCREARGDRGGPR